MNINCFLFQHKNFYLQLIGSAWQFLLRGIVLSLCIIFLYSCQTAPQNNNGVIHLTLWQGINPPVNRDVFQKLVTKFNQTHTDVEVESIYAGQLDQQLPKILTSIVGNVPPDILAFYPEITGKFIELDAIRPLDDWLQNLPVTSEVSPKLFEQLKLDGHIWSVPFQTSNIGIFYRPKLFQAAGITEIPKTWEELRQVAKKLTIDRNGDNRPEQYGILMPLGKGGWSVFSWLPFLFSAGGEIVTNNRPNLTNAGAIAALQFWQDLLKDGSAMLSLPERGYEEDAFIGGRVAMQITGPWTYITRSNVDYDVLPIPANVRSATASGTGNMYLMKTTLEREKAALKFLEYLLSEEFQTEWAIGTGFLPINIKAAQSKVYQQYISEKPWLKVFLDQMSVAQSLPLIAEYNRVSESLGRAIEAALLGESPQKALTKAQEHLEIIWDGK